MQNTQQEVALDSIQMVTIGKILPLYKENEEAESIELISFKENGFQVVSQKGLYKVGQKAFYIQPDFCLPDIPIFESFIRPNGEESKSYLGKIEGKPRRIRAKRFNMHKGDGAKVYSEGILLSQSMIEESLKIRLDSILGGLVPVEELAIQLGITKYIPLEETSSDVTSSSFPSDMYKTDETNINNLWNYLDNKVRWPMALTGTVKVDGSSISLFYKNGKSGICSRNLLKPLTITKVVGVRKKKWWEKLAFWLKPDLKIYKEVQSDSDFVKVGLPYLRKLEEFCKEKNLNLVLRGELCGQGLKGSGNKNNPHAKGTPRILFYGVDSYENGSVKMDVEDFEYIIANLSFDTRNVVFDTCDRVFDKVFHCKAELQETCDQYFKNNLVEGIVVRGKAPDFSSPIFSAKYMNPEYDSKK